MFNVIRKIWSIINRAQRPGMSQRGIGIFRHAPTLDDVGASQNELTERPGMSLRENKTFRHAPTLEFVGENVVSPVRLHDGCMNNKYDVGAWRSRLDSCCDMPGRGLLIILIALLILSPIPALADTCTSVASNVWNNAATWSCSGAETIPDSDDAVVIDGETVTLNQSEAASTISITSGTLDIASYTLNVTGSWSVTGGDFDGGTGTVDFDGCGVGVTVGTNQFYDVIFDCHWGTMTITGTMNIAGDLRTDRAQNGITGAIVFNGSTDQILNSPKYTTADQYGSLYNATVTVDKSGGSLILAADFRCKNLIINNTNTFDVTNSNYRVDIESLSNSGTFLAYKGIVVFRAGNYTI